MLIGYYCVCIIKQLMSQMNTFIYQIYSKIKKKTIQIIRYDLIKKVLSQ